MAGYWHDAEQTRAAFTADGFVRTGDLGWLDARGRLRLVGRSKEMYVRGGYNVYPVEVESVLSTHPGIAAVAIVPRPDEVMGEVGVAVVVPRDPQRAPALRELREFAGPQVASYKLPDALHVVDALPLTAGEKIDRRALVAEIGKLVT
jgi:acyl-CoA synthetase (AMP-forming)/AMP-acid ligase II